MSTLTRLHRTLYNALSRDSTAGILLLIAAVAGFVLANSAAAPAYEQLAETTIGPKSWHLQLTVAQWASDGLLALFFFTIGLELKYEIVAGSLRNIRQAAVPVIAALGGVVVPALVYLLVVNAGGEASASRGWAVPTATDIAFALAVLAIFGKGLPRALRIFMLTLAVVDDLVGISVIALVYSGSIHFGALAGSLLMVVLFGVVSRMRRPWWGLLPLLFVAAWVFMHWSGVHATISGVLLGLVVPARQKADEPKPRTHSFEYGVRVLSAGIAVPVFAFFAAGVRIVGVGGDLNLPVLFGVVAALLIGKAVGVMGSAALVVRFTPLRLPANLDMRDLLPVGVLTGIGFTVSLLVAVLAFTDAPHQESARLGILIGSLLAGIIGAILLRLEARRHAKKGGAVEA